MSYTSVGRVTDFREGLVRVFEVDGADIAVVTHEGRFYAFTGRCPHANYSFNFTRVKEGDRILCSSHFAWFDLATGEVQSGPTDESLTHYPVKVENDEVLVSTEQE